MNVDIQLTVNGETVAEAVEPRTTLVDFLRETLGLTGSHVGCEHGVCGACTVLLNGTIVRGCLTLAVQCDGAKRRNHRGRLGFRRDRRPAGGLPPPQCAAMRLLHPGHAAHLRRSSGARRPPRAVIPSANISPGTTAAAPATRRSSTPLNPSRRRAQKGEAMNQHTRPQSISEQADHLEEEMMHELERVVSKSTLHYLADGEVKMDTSAAAWAKNPKAIFNMGPDPRLPPMPAKPTLIDYFKCRFAQHAHLLQSATHALKNGCNEKVILACLLHDIAVVSFNPLRPRLLGRADDRAYVDEEVSWAVRTHQALRFFPDEASGYKYPDMYIKLFGDDYKPEPYIVAEYERAKNHKWYMTSRLICVNDIYSFDPNMKVNLDDFVDIVGRNFRQPEEGLGFDNSPSSHMWRTMMWPNRFL
jgi:hypothetical protein